MEKVLAKLDDAINLLESLSVIVPLDGGSHAKEAMIGYLMSGRDDLCLVRSKLAEANKLVRAGRSELVGPEEEDSG